MMNAKDRAKAARKSLMDAAHQFEAGDELKGSQKMWDAAEHAVFAVACARGWESATKKDLDAAIWTLYEESGDIGVLGGFSVAGKFRNNAEYDFMEDFQFDDDREIVCDFVARTLAMVE